jgi:hypothetical protein
VKEKSKELDEISRQENLHSQQSHDESFSDFENKKDNYDGDDDDDDDDIVSDQKNISFSRQEKKKKSTKKLESKQAKRLSKNKISNVLFPPGKKQSVKFNSKTVKKAWLKL